MAARQSYHNNLRNTTECWSFPDFLGGIAEMGFQTNPYAGAEDFAMLRPIVYTSAR